NMMYDEENAVLKDFARAHRLRKLKKDDCGDWNIIGRRGDIYEYGSGLLAVTVLRCPNAKYWNQVRHKAQALGCLVTQNGDTEGTFLIDPENPIQAKCAIE